MQCSNCDTRAVVAIKTGGLDSVRGLNSTVYYEPENAPRGSDPLCKEHGVGLIASLIQLLT